MGDRPVTPDQTFDLLTTLDPGALVEARGRLWEVAAPKKGLDGKNAVLQLRAVGEIELGVPDQLQVLLGRDEPIEDVTIADLPGIFNTPTRISAYPDWRSLVMALRLSAVGAGDRPTSLQDARIEIAWYQYEPVVKALAQRVPRLLIADDVGLGKTIEAGLILLELHARRRADRVLVVVPANLQYQWRDELWDKFGFRFRVFDRDGIADVEGTLEVGQNPWRDTSWVIASVDLLKDRAHRRALLDDPELRWDLVIIDEAHHVAPSADAAGRRTPTLRSEFAEALAERADGLLLLTATPHDGYRATFVGLLSLLDPSVLPDPENIADRDRQVIGRHFVRRLKAWLLDEDGRRLFQPRRAHTLPVRMEAEEQKLYDAVSKYIERKHKAAERTADRAKDTAERRNARVAAFAMEVLKKRLGSSWAAISRSLGRRVSSREKALADEIDELAATVDPEAVDRDVEALADGEELTEQATLEAEDRLVASVRATAKEIAELRQLAARAERIARGRSDAKSDAVARLVASIFDGTCEVEGRRVQGERVVLFTEYLDTRDHLFERLKGEPWARGGEAIARMEGGLSRRERELALRRFRSGHVLLATDAVSEGINLQDYAHLVVHAEIPWNPNRLEQRNGRVDRKGQTEEVFVWNVLLAGTYEGRVLARVLGKLEAIRNDVGSANALVGRRIELDVLGPMVREEDLRGRLVAGGVEGDAEETARSVEELIDDRRRTEDEYRRRTGLFATTFGPDESVEYRENLQSLRPDAVTPDDTEDYVRRRLETRGIELEPDRERPSCWRPWHDGRIELHAAREALRLHPDEPADRDNPVRPFTFDRDVALAKPEVAFVSARHPLVQTIVAADRRRLWQPGAGGMPGRLAHGAAVEREELGAVIFVFEGHLQDGGGQLLERRLLPVYVSPQGHVSRVADDDGRRAFLPRRAEPRADAASERVTWAADHLEAAGREAARRLEARAAELEAEQSRRVEEALASFDAALPRRRRALVDAIGDRQQELALTLAERQRQTRLRRKLEEFDHRTAAEREAIAARRGVRVAAGRSGPVREMACLLLVEPEEWA